MKDMNFEREVFREPHNSGSVDIVLNKYARAINKTNSTGALLFSVVGKLFTLFFYNQKNVHNYVASCFNF